MPDLRAAGEDIGNVLGAVLAANASGVRRDPPRMLPDTRGISMSLRDRRRASRIFAHERERVFRVMPAISPRTSPTADTTQRICL